MTKELPSPELLRKLLRYEPDTGKLFWRERTPDMFKERGKGGSLGSCSRWNGRYAGKEAFTSTAPRGHKAGDIFDQTFKAHRVAWAVHHGSWPSLCIDHKNGDPSDNRIANLRDVPHAINMRNAKKNADNTTGHNGVYWDKERKKWYSKITVNGKQVFLGRFADIHQAIAVREAAEDGLGYTGRHGR